MELSATDLDSITRAISEARGVSVKQVLSAEHKGGFNYDVTVEFYGQGGSYTLHVDKMPGLGWVYVGVVAYS